MPRAWLFRLAVLFALLATQRASIAHAGPVEQLHQLSFQPGHPDRQVLRYANGGDGLFYSRDSGKTFALTCVSAIDPALQRIGPVALTGDGATLIGTFNGLWEDDGSGCGWSMVGEFDGLWVADIAQHPTDDAVVFAVSSNARKPNGIFRRNADRTWTEIGSREEVLINTIDAVAVGDKLRFYEGVLKVTDAAMDGGAATSQYVLRVSDDEGESWQEHPFVQNGPGELRIAAVDPTSPDRIVVSIDREGEDDSVLVSSDKGATFREYLTLSQYGGIAFAPDGRVWIGETGSTTSPNAPTGLWAAASLDQDPKKVADYVVQCLAYEPASETLYACQHWFLGAVDPITGAFTASFKFSEAKQFSSCDGVDTPAMCKAQLCSAYCGPGHFAEAPLCSAYSDPNCGPAASDVGGATGSGGSGGRADAGNAVDAGSGGVRGAAGSGGTGAGTGAGKPEKRDDGGCSVASVGDGALPFDRSSIAGLALVLVRLRRRRNS